MVVYIVLIIGFLSLALYAGKSKAFYIATPLVIILSAIVCLCGFLVLVSKTIAASMNVNLYTNPYVLIPIIIFISIYISGWIVDKKTEVIVPDGYTKNYLIMIFEVEGANRIRPTMFRYPKTYRLKFPKTGIISTSQKQHGSCYFFTMSKILDSRGKIYLPNKKLRFFYSTSKRWKGFYVDILFLDNSSPSSNNVNFDFLDELNINHLKSINERKENDA